MTSLLTAGVSLGLWALNFPLLYYYHFFCCGFMHSNWLWNIKALCQGADPNVPVPPWNSQELPELKDWSCATPLDRAMRHQRQVTLQQIQQAALALKHGDSTELEVVRDNAEDWIVRLRSLSVEVSESLSPELEPSIYLSINPDNHFLTPSPQQGLGWVKNSICFFGAKRFHYKPFLSLLKPYICIYLCI